MGLVYALKNRLSKKTTVVTPESKSITTRVISANHSASSNHKSVLETALLVSARFTKPVVM